ncbi:MAG: hypothetical protein JNM84_20755 [Planctomycetes bacterium]|nr:hypothetical protein [Planctomycetota bacterium]
MSARPRHFLGWVTCLAALLLALASAPLPAQTAASQAAEARIETARAEWKRLSREERAELLRRFDALRRASPVERDRVFARAEVLGHRSRRLIEELQSFEPEKLRALRALPENERRIELRRLLELRLESELRALRERLSEAEWQRLRELKGAERSRALAQALREETQVLARRSLERWTREGVLDRQTAEEIAGLPAEERLAAFRGASRRSAEKRLRALIDQRPELFPEPSWRSVDELEPRAAMAALRTARERVQRALTGLPHAFPAHLLPSPPELRSLHALPLPERRVELRRMVSKRIEEWARRGGASEEEVARWKELELERAVQEIQRWRSSLRSGPPRERRR